MIGYFYILGSFESYITPMINSIRVINVKKYSPSKDSNSENENSEFRGNQLKEFLESPNKQDNQNLAGSFTDEM